MTHDASRVTVEVAAGLILREGRYLIARRKVGAHLERLWEFPGGKREPGESLEECLRRELREELGIVISTAAPFRVIRHEYPVKAVELHFFLCSVEDEQAPSLNCDALRWVAPEEMTGLEFPSANRPLIEALQQKEERH